MPEEAEKVLTDQKVHQLFYTYVLIHIISKNLEN